MNKSSAGVKRMFGAVTSRFVTRTNVEYERGRQAATLQKENSILVGQA
jgi:hypothetical protein